MKDAIGQEIEVGDTIVHCGGLYASAKLHEVTKLTQKRVQVESPQWHHVASINFRPDTVINVTLNLEKLDD